MARLDDKVAVVTGGASGIGLAAAKNFIENGAKVVIADFNTELGEKVAKEFGASAIFVKTDVAIEDDIIKLIDTTVATFGKIDIVVASAGIGGGPGDIVNSTMEQWDKVTAIDYTGVFLTNKYAIKQMLDQGTGGSVINIASMFGLVAAPGNVHYTGAKGGVVNISRAAGVAYAKEGIRVNAVCPGVIDTPLNTAEVKKMWESRHPMGRLGTVEEVANLINFLASDEATFMTGASIAIDGGYTAV